MGEKVTLGKLPTPSTAITSELVFESDGAAAILRFEFDREGIIYRGGVRFDNPRAYRFRAESHCTAWHIESAYDTIAEVAPSDWVTELKMAAPTDLRTLWDMHHFMIYIDSSGCFEVVGSGWSLIPEEQVR